MSSSQRATALLALGFVLFASAVSANKGPNQYIRFHNETAVQLGVAVDPTAGIYSALSTVSMAPTNFVNAGGQILNSGTQVRDWVQVGTHTVLAADFSQPTTANAVEYITESVTVPANQTVDVYIKPGVSGTFPTIYFSATP